MKTKSHFRLVASLVVCLIGGFQSRLLSQTPAGQDQPSGINWQRGPVQAKLGEIATIQIPEGYAFADSSGARRFLELAHNPTSGQELGIILPIPRKGDPASDGWFMLFEFDETGYITDHDDLDADRILESIKKGTDRANEVRRSKGWPAFHVTGWALQPFYDSQSHNLTWAINGRGDEGPSSDAVNYSIRILGRRGAMSVDLVMDPSQTTTVLPRFGDLLHSFSYLSGNKYADFMKGDKVAGYGLTALIAGGAGAVAVKTGLISKLWTLLIGMLAAVWKFILVLLAAVASALRKVWSSMTGKKNKSEMRISR